ncbi:MAG TPA: secretin, partial [Firmicutes bacterium]|nr:secretin [Bacillota bacterium]
MRKQAALLGLTLVLLVSAVVSVAAEEPLVNLFLFDTDLREALSEISLQTGINIIPDATVSGVVTADLQDVPLEKALRMILIGGGFAFKKIDDFYFVGLPDPRSTTFSELVDTEVVRLRHATSDQIIAALPAFLSPYVQAGYDSRIVTISAPPAELERIKDLIQAVDQPQQQIEIQVIVTEVSTDFLKDFGSKMFSYSMQAG